MLILVSHFEPLHIEAEVHSDRMSQGFSCQQTKDVNGLSVAEGGIH